MVLVKKKRLWQFLKPGCFDLKLLEQLTSTFRYGEPLLFSTKQLQIPSFSQRFWVIKNIIWSLFSEKCIDDHCNINR